MNRLEQIIKEEIDSYLLEQQLIEEGLGDWFKNKIQVVKDKASELKKAGVREGYETVLAAKILLNIIKNKDASPEEVKFLKSQAADLAKVVTLLGLQPVPGNNVIIKILDSVFKKFKIPFSFYPSSHTNDDNKNVLQKAYPDKELFEALIDETHTAQRDLVKLTESILKNLAENLIMQKEEGEELTMKNFPILTLDSGSGESYNEIQEFVDNVNFPVYFVDKTSTGAGGGVIQTYDDGGIIDLEVRVRPETFKLIKDELDSGVSDPEELYFYPLRNTLASSLLHELQHAYDSWRSDGKALDSGRKDGYNKLRADYKDILSKKSKDFTPEEIKAIEKSHEAYLNLQHEINARFAQALDDIALTSRNYESDDLEVIKADWNKVLSDFKISFKGWDVLSNKMKKRLSTRLAKSFQEEYELRKKEDEEYED